MLFENCIPFVCDAVYLALVFKFHFGTLTASTLPNKVFKTKMKRKHYFWHCDFNMVSLILK